MTRDDCILDVFRKALEQFLTNTVIKQQNEIFNKILGNTTPRIYHTTRSYCDECNVRNLRLLHSQDQCFSQSHCLCRSKNRKRRPCPNGICDYMLEAIIDEHYYKSPNLKHTDFRRWTKSNGYWEIALCYMQNKSESAERASLSDLFNLVTNNRFVLRSPENDSCTTIIENEFREVTRKCTYACKLLEDNLQLTDIEAIITFLEYIQDDRCIQKLEEIWSGQKAKKTEPIFKYAGTLYDLENHVLEEFRKYARLQHKCSTAGTSVNQAADILRVHFKQNCVVDDKQENTCDAVKIIFGRTFKGTCIVADFSKGIEVEGYYRQKNKQLFVYTILEHYTQKNRSEMLDDYDGVFVLSEEFSKVTGMSVPELGSFVRKCVFPKSKRCLILLEFSVSSEVLCYLEENTNEHIIVTLTDNCDEVNELQNQSHGQVIRILPVTAVNITGTQSKLVSNQYEQRNVQKTIQTCINITGEKLKILSLEAIWFKKWSKQIDISGFTSLEIVKISKCKLTPKFNTSVQQIIIELSNSALSTIVEQLSPILHRACYDCPYFRTLTTNKIKFRDKSFRIILKKTSLEVDVKRHLKLNSLLSCDLKLTSLLVSVEISKILTAAKCNKEDFEATNNSEEKKIILNSICFGLRENSDNLVHVYAASCEKNAINPPEIVIVCYLRENYDFSLEGAWGEYRGFKTYTRSYDNVSTESANAERMFQFDCKCVKEISETDLKDMGSIIASYSEDLLRSHSNLEAITISMGRAKNGRLDTSGGPCIVLYVRLKSFIPYNEKSFPNELVHPSCRNIKFNVDVREGFYEPIADVGEGLGTFLSTPTLLMGSSIGIKDYDKSSATLGPFVEWLDINRYNTVKLGFLTACHAFCLKDDTCVAKNQEVDQPSDADKMTNIKPNTRNVEKGCGKVAAVKYTKDVDAAVIEITSRHPIKGLFIDCKENILRIAGLKEKPEYNDGSSAEPNTCVGKKIVKVGKESFLTVGMCVFNQNVVTLQRFDVEAVCPHTGKGQIVVMENQFSVRKWRNLPLDFCYLGDSGAGVFVINEGERLSCIGMLIGRLSDGTAIVTPIKRILDALSEELPELRLKVFNELTN